MNHAFLSYKPETDFAQRPRLKLRMVGEKAEKSAPVSQRAAERMIGGQVFGSRVLRALAKHDASRKRPETTTAREIVRTELTNFILECERVNFIPNAGEVKNCVWISTAAAIGFAAGCIFMSVVRG